VTFPVGAIIVVDRKNGVTILKQGEPLSIVPDGFLDSWLRRSPDVKAKQFYPE
jgi:hypothetical protein